MKQCCKFYLNGIESNLERNDPIMAKAYANVLAAHIQDEHRKEVKYEWEKNSMKGKL